LEKSGSFPALLHTLITLVRWSNTFIYYGVLVLVVIGIIINRDDLQSINVDGLYIVLLIIAGSMGFYFNFFACFSLISVLFLTYFSYTKKIKFTRTAPTVWIMSSLALLVFLLFILIIRDSLNLPSLENIYRGYFNDILGPVFEEALFRGLFWGFLRDRKVKETRILIIQMLVFMAAHLIYAVLNPLAFWVIIPAIGMLLGLMVLRSKSIAPGTLLHVLYNIALDLLSTTIS
jgi:membrane protease YdiL (CAAX protease family)